MGTVQLQNLRKSYGTTQVVHGVDLAVDDGEFMVFVGPSGCGKSTLLRMIAGLEDITDGQLSIAGVPVNQVPPAQRGAAMVFQNYALYPHMTVAQNMGFALKLAGQSRQEVQQAVGRAAEILRLTHLLDRKPRALSGGERQRVAIGRAIVRKPAVFLFDEPLSNLDAALRVQMRLELAGLHRELGTTMIYVTHDQVEAMTLGHRIAVFNAGRMEQVGTPLALYARPANTFVAGFLGSPRMNLLPCEPRQDGVLVMGRHPVALPGGQLCAGPSQAQLLPSRGAGAACGDRGSTHKAATQLGVRPEHIELRTDGAGLPAQVDVLEHLGDVVIAHCRVPELPQWLAVKLDARAAGGLAASMPVSLVPQAMHCVLFDAAGRACH